VEDAGPTPLRACDDFALMDCGDDLKAKTMEGVCTAKAPQGQARIVEMRSKYVDTLARSVAYGTWAAPQLIVHD
jgi:hypothetical protein